MIEAHAKFAGNAGDPGAATRWPFVLLPLQSSQVLMQQVAPGLLLDHLPAWLSKIHIRKSDLGQKSSRHFLSCARMLNMVERKAQLKVCLKFIGF